MASTVPADVPLASRPIDWMNVAFLGGVHLLGLAGMVAIAMGRVAWQTIVFAVLWNLACSIAITGAYHRLFSHISYRAAWPVRLMYLLFGAASVQNTALKWSSLHRRHHAYCDTDRDPYDARRGFWWSHVGWVFRKGQDDFSNVPDLKEDPLVMWQHRNYYVLLAVFAFLLPIGICTTWGDPLGGLLVAFGLRLVVQYHSTFAINSIAHMVGHKPYTKRGTPRDSWFTALVTLGEGYHDYHHRFPADYRNGVRWYDFDPTKWWIWALSKVGLAGDLKRIADSRIAEARACACEPGVHAH